MMLFCPNGHLHHNRPPGFMIYAGWTRSNCPNDWILQTKTSQSSEVGFRHFADPAAPFHQNRKLHRRSDPDLRGCSKKAAWNPFTGG